jgi:hypothetical protein
MILDDLDTAFQHPDVMTGEPLLLSLGHVAQLENGEAWIKTHSEHIENQFNNRYFFEITPELQSLAKKLTALGLNVKLPEPKR